MVSAESRARQPGCVVRQPAGVWTVGHSTRTWDAFRAVLDAHGIEAIADVRRFPGSRRYPWFASETMADALPVIGMQYLWVPELGGRRKVRPGSLNGAWRNAAFQGYADHMASDEFQAGLAKVLALAGERRTALMCAEAVWWRCHRRLIADLLQHRGVPVLHIIGDKPAQPHPQSADARAAGQDLVYPPVQPGLFS